MKLRLSHPVVPGKEPVFGMVADKNRQCGHIILYFQVLLVK